MREKVLTVISDEVSRNLPDKISDDLADDGSGISSNDGSGISSNDGSGISSNDGSGISLGDISIIPGGINSAGRGLKPAVMRTYHLTFPTHSRYLAFMRPENARMILKILHSFAKQYAIVLHEACAMPDHVHLLVSFVNGRDLNKEIVKKLKGASSRFFHLKLSSTEENLWARGKHFQEISSQELFTKTLLYIRDNPLRAHLPPTGRILSQIIADFNPLTAEFIPR